MNHWILASRLIAVALASPVYFGSGSEAEAVIPHDTQITPGQLRGISHAPGDPWIYGYWEYLPTDFDLWMPGDPGLPLLVALPGVGEYDDVSSCPGGTDVCTPADCDDDGLCRNLVWGPQLLMQDGAWDETQRPFIMVSPQHPVPPGSVIEWDLADLDAFIEFIVDNYPVDERRLYLIGTSQGGRAALQYTTENPRRFAAIAPTPGGAVTPLDAPCYFEDTALWIFHGEDDADGTLGLGVFAPCTMVDLAYRYDNPDLYAGTSPQCAAIVGQPRPDGRVTIFDDVGHFAWVETVDPIGAGFPASEWAVDQGCGIAADFREYDAALDPDGVYSWFLSVDRPRATPPDAVLLHDMAELSLSATIVDDDPWTIQWTQTAGPAATLDDTDTATLDVAGLAPLQQYAFEVYVVDADGQWDRGEVLVTTDVFPGSASGSTGSTGSTGSSGSSGSTGPSDPTGSSRGETAFATGAAATEGTGDAASDTSASAATTAAAASGPGATADTTASAGTGSTGDTTGEAGRTAVDDGAEGCGCRPATPAPATPGSLLVGVIVGRRRRRRRA